MILKDRYGNVEMFIDADNYIDPKKTSVINKVKTSETPDKFNRKS